MSIGLIALLDDIAAIAKVAAASLDDVASQAAKAGIKAAVGHIRRHWTDNRRGLDSGGWNLPLHPHGNC